MRLRLLLVLALSFLALGALAGSSSSATAPPKIDPFLGDWTMTAGADGALVGSHLVITQSTASDAYALVGPEWVNPTETAWYDSHCGSKATVYAYVVLQYTWAPQASMGGCLSNKTVPHVDFAGLHKEAGNVRVLSGGGLDTLTGTWDTIDNHICCTHHPIAGARPRFEFTAGVQGHRVLPKKTNGPKILLTKLLGLGSVSVLNGTQVGDAELADSIGTIHFHKWTIWGHDEPNVDEDLLVLTVEKTGASFVHEGGVDFLKVGVLVTKAEHNETDHCPVGAEGSLSIRDGSVEGKKDVVTLHIARCSVDEVYVNGYKGSKVGVGLTYKKP